jgi:colanic acid biosynthesis protein WcaH
VNNNTSPKYFLDPELFGVVVENTPLVAIDFIVIDSESMLVGKRINRPAKDMFFVPGGRICKGESFKSAFSRVSETEIGKSLAPDDCKFLGIFDHFYPNSAVSEDISTHYTVLAHVVDIRDHDLDLDKMFDQHTEFKMMRMQTVVDNNRVHENTKTYARLLL